MVLTSWSLLRTSCIYGYRHTLVHSFWYVTSYEQCFCTYYVSVYIFINKISRLAFVSISQVIGCEDRLRNDLYCVGWGVKLYSNSKLKAFIMCHHMCSCVTHVCRIHNICWEYYQKQNRKCFAIDYVGYWPAF